MAKQRAEGQRRREVEGWRASGVSAAQYAARRGYSVTSLFRWAQEGARARELAAAGPQFARLSVAASVSPAAETALVVEIGRARVRVPRGFDASLLRAVLEALSGERES